MFCGLIFDKLTDLMNRFSPEIPMRLPNQEVAETRKSFVDGYLDISPLVVKYKKPHVERSFGDTNAAIANVDMVRRKRAAIVAELRSLGEDEGIIPPTTPVIHQSDDGKITYSETQEWFQDASTLSDLGTNVHALPAYSTRELRNLFWANIKFWKKEGYSLDIVGSIAKPRSWKNKLLRNILPLYYSENIMVNAKGHPRFVDIGKFDKNAKRDLKTTVRHYLHLAGSFISAGILSLTLESRRHQA